MRLGLLFGSALVTGLALGCGGGSSYPTAGGSTTTTTTTPTPDNVSIAEYAFSPETLTVKAGTQVTWMNGGSVAHTATADGGAIVSLGPLTLRRREKIQYPSGELIENEFPGLTRLRTFSALRVRNGYGVTLGPRFFVHDFFFPIFSAIRLSCQPALAIHCGLQTNRIHC
jgi:plastocyanin